MKRGLRLTMTEPPPAMAAERAAGIARTHLSNL